MSADLDRQTTVSASTTDETPPILRVRVGTDTFDRFKVTPSGVYTGAGSAAPQQTQPRSRHSRVAAAVAETWPRLGSPIGNVAPLTTQQLYVTAIELPANLPVTGASFTTGTQAAVGPTNWWYVLADASRAVVAVTADQLTAAMAASTDLPVAFGATYTTTAAGLYYVGIMVKASSTVPSLQGLTTTAVMNTTAPILAGTSNTAQTTPPALAATLTAVTAGTIQAYAYLY